jgi:hypothetical protein
MIRTGGILIADPSMKEIKRRSGRKAKPIFAEAPAYPTFRRENERIAYRTRIPGKFAILILQEYFMITS